MSAADFLSGVSMATFAAAGVFFLKFWLASRQRFYLLFCAACWSLSVERIVLFFVQQSRLTTGHPLVEASSWVYLLRLTAFILILIAVVNKNMRTE
jgi:hypothetical protein